MAIAGSEASSVTKAYVVDGERLPAPARARLAARRWRRLQSDGDHEKASERRQQLGDAVLETSGAHAMKG
jgi:hypothetical protein